MSFGNYNGIGDLAEKCDELTTTMESRAILARELVADAVEEGELTVEDGTSHPLEFLMEDLKREAREISALLGQIRCRAHPPQHEEMTGGGAT